MKIAIVAGTRPNFIKVAALIKSLEKKDYPGMSYELIHTGQHYDDAMSKVFFEDLELKLPDVNLEVGSGTQAGQTGQIMVRFEEYLLNNDISLVLVVGDVNSTMACSIVAKKCGLPLVHVEAGIRSFDLSMPEEINRMVTDSITDHFYTTSEVANHNLRQAGIEDERIHFVGNVMIDTLLSCKDRFRKPHFFEDEKLEKGNYWLLTLHRPGNVDSAENLQRLLKRITANSGGKKMLFPIHPRTRKIFDSIEDMELKEAFILLPPMRYLEFMFMVQHSLGVITDSGGITEETTVLGIPCITLRPNTERPETVTSGTNALAISDEHISEYMTQINKGNWKRGQVPKFWDGNTAERIMDSIYQIFVVQ